MVELKTTLKKNNTKITKTHTRRLGSITIQFSAAKFEPRLITHTSENNRVRPVNYKKLQKTIRFIIA